MVVCANTGPAASERSAKAAIRVFIFDLHRLNGKPSVRMAIAGIDIDLVAGRKS